MRIKTTTKRILDNLIMDAVQVLERKKGRSAEEPVYFYHTDHLGSTTLLTDSTGNVVQALSYLPYGEEWTEYNRAFAE